MTKRTISARLNEVQAKGVLYDVTIQQMVPDWLTRFGPHIVASIDGYYTDSYNNKQNVKSNRYVFTTFDKRDDFFARVYIDPNNIKLYAVELFRKE